MSKRRERTERVQALLAEPQTLRDLCAFLSTGTLAKWCRQHDVRYGDVYSWLHDVDYPDRLDAYTKALESRASYFSDVVLDGLHDIATLDLRKLYDGKGDLIDPHMLPDDVARAVVSHEVEDTQYGTRKRAKIEARTKGHELLGRSVGLFRDKVEVEGRVTLEDLVAGSHQGDTGRVAPGLSARESPPTRRSPSKPKKV